MRFDFPIPGELMIGKVSEFGGPNDKHTKEDEGLALYESNQISLNAHLFLGEQPSGTTGLIRRLNPESFYCAMRWNYRVTPKHILRRCMVSITYRNKHVWASPVDYGPGIKERLIDVSPAVMKLLGVKTDELVNVILRLPS